MVSDCEPHLFGICRLIRIILTDLARQHLILGSYDKFRGTDFTFAIYTLADPYKQALLMTNGHPILNFILLIVIYLAIRFHFIQINFTLVPELFNHPEQFQRLMTVEEKQTLQSASHTVKQISFRFTNPMMSFLFTPPTVSKILDQPSQ
ncbi:hypothetical protein [Enterococcus cecorum]|uniref:hypothetical protein n=1 Tax=Enterococcus cecorum TaxID=44008 RepID=UPI002ACA1DAB|nr:hypothetical protein [Enterococcus cecorum]MDZ5587970.1 hypothetical protein [Enterococcus cecorum]